MSATLQIEVYTSRAKLPVPNATVAVTQRLPDGRYDLLAIQITNSSGFTAPIDVTTPPSALTTAPSGEVGYALCDVWAECPTFEMLIAENVQLFPDTANIQPMALVPLPEGGRSLATTVVRKLAPQNL